MKRTLPCHFHVQLRNYGYIVHICGYTKVFFDINNTSCGHNGTRMNYRNTEGRKTWSEHATKILRGRNQVTSKRRWKERIILKPCLRNVFCHSASGQTMVPVTNVQSRVIYNVIRRGLIDT
jgi:hypothetical protein